MLGMYSCSKSDECTCTITYNYEDSTGVDHIYYSLESAERKNYPTCKELGQGVSRRLPSLYTSEGYLVRDYDVSCYDN